MKIVNHTQYLTKDLRRIFLACIRKRGYPENKYIVVHPSRTSNVHGYAYIGVKGWHCTGIHMFMPDEKDIQSIGQVFMHELDHNAGLRHKEMLDCGRIDASFLDGMPLRVKEVRQVSKEDIIKKKFTQLEKTIKRKQSRIKRLNTLLKKDEKKRKVMLRKNVFLNSFF